MFTSAYLKRHKRLEIGLILIDNKDAMFVSILRKRYGDYEALPYFAESCEI